MFTSFSIPAPFLPSPLWGAAALDPLPLWQSGLLLGAAVVAYALATWRLVPQAGHAVVRGIARGMQWIAAGTFLAGLCSLLLLALRRSLPDVSVTIEPAWPWPLVLVLNGALLALVLITYPPRIRHLPPGTRRLLLGLRLVALAIIVFAMFRPAIQWTRTDRQSAVFAVIADPSRSMNTADEAGDLTRHQAQLKKLAEVQPLFEQLARESQVEFYELNKGLAPVKAWSSEAQGDQTPVGLALDELAKSSQSRRVVGAVALSDFKQAAVPPYDADPRLAAQRLAELRIPLHTVPFGSTGISGSALDLIAEDLQVSPTVFEKNEVVVGAKIRALGAAGRELTVRLLVESSRAPPPGEQRKMEVAGLPQRITPARNEDLIPVELTFTPQSAGEFKIALEVVPLEGELLTANNTLTTFITVLKGGLNVAYFDKVRPELKWMRRITESPDIQLDFKQVRYDGRVKMTDIDASWFEPGKYDVYIIGDVPANVFDPLGSGGRNLRMLKAAVERGAGLLMTGGSSNFAAGGYADTPLADVLPVLMDPAQVQDRGKLDADLHYFGPQQMLPTAAGLGHFVMRLDSPSANPARWKSLPPLEGANKFTRANLKPLAQTLAETPQGAPLLVAQDVGQGRSMAFGADTTYLWYLGGDGAAHQRFWRQIILWLAHKELQGDSTVWLKLASRRFRPGQPVEMTFGARSPDGLALDDAEFRVRITGPDGQQHNPVPQRVAQEHSARLVDTKQAGEYTALVEATHGGQVVGSTQARFVVYEQDLELQNPSADFDLARELARATGGEFVMPEELGSFLRRLLREGLRSEAKQVSAVSLWDHWLVLVLFIATLSGEWFYRKSRGLV